MTFAIVRVTVVSKGYTTQGGARKQAEITWLYFWSYIEFAIGMLSTKAIAQTMSNMLFSFDRCLPSFLPQPIRPKEQKNRRRRSSEERIHPARRIRSVEDESDVGQSQVLPAVTFREHEIEFRCYEMWDDFRRLKRAIASTECFSQRPWAAGGQPVWS
jgi:hypothetical protein